MKGRCTLRSWESIASFLQLALSLGFTLVVLVRVWVMLWNSVAVEYDCCEWRRELRSCSLSEFQRAVLFLFKSRVFKEFVTLRCIFYSFRSNRLYSKLISYFLVGFVCRICFGSSQFSHLSVPIQFPLLNELLSDLVLFS